MIRFLKSLVIGVVVVAAVIALSPARTAHRDAAAVAVVYIIGAIGSAWLDRRHEARKEARRKAREQRHRSSGFSAYR